MSRIELLHPAALWLLVATPVILLAFRGRRAGTGATAWWSMALLRVVASSLLILALAAPVWEHPSEAVTVVHAIDVSASLPPADVLRAASAIREAGLDRTPRHGGYVLFGEDAAAVDSAQDLSHALARRDPEGRNVLQGRGGTDLGRALETAAAALPAAGCRHVVLASDGRHTRGELWPVVERLRLSGIRVHTLQGTPAPPRAAASIIDVSLPEHPRAGRPVTVELMVRAADALPARLGIGVDGHALSWSPVALPAGDSRWRLDAIFPDPGLHPMVLKIDVEGAGEAAADDEWMTDVSVDERFRVLQLADDPARVRGFATVLSQQGFRVDTWTPQHARRDRIRLHDYDTVVVHDPSRDRVGTGLQRDLEGYVREGGGLVFIAGERSHGRDGWAGTTLERLLPVRFIGPRRKDELDLLLLVDRSYSMRGPRLETAKVATAAAIDALEDRHRVGVIAFDARSHELIALQRRADARAQLGRVGALTAEGQTNLFQALWGAYLQLRQSKATLRHVILLSDGNSAPVGFRAPQPGDPVSNDQPPDSFEALGSRLAAAGISVSTVAIGDEPNLDLMGLIARTTGGKAYVAQSGDQVPSLFAGEAKRLTGDSVVEKRFIPRVVFPANAIDGVEVARIPPLLGLAISTPRPHADVILEGIEKHPLLVTHRYGLGQVTAFMADVSGRWSAPWRQWPEFGRLWAQTLQAGMREPGGDVPRFHVTPSADGAVVTLDLPQAWFAGRRDLAPIVSLATPAGELARQPLTAVAPGRYVTRFELVAEQARTLRVDLVDGGGLPDEVVKAIGPRTVRLGGNPRLRDGARDAARLRLISERTGGRVTAGMPDGLPACGDTTTDRRSLVPLLCAAALLLYLAELGIRRLRSR